MICGGGYLGGEVVICGGGYVGRWASDMWRWVCREMG